MRKIEIYLQTSSSEIDSAITAMQFLKALKAHEPKLDFAISFFTSFDEFTQKKLLKSPNAVEEFFTFGSKKIDDKPETQVAFEERPITNDTVQGSEYTGYKETHQDAETGSEKVRALAETETEFESESEDKRDNSFDREDSYKEAKFRIPIARDKKSHHMPVDKIIFGIYNPDDIVTDDDLEIDQIDMVWLLSSMMCACIKVPPSVGVSDALLHMYKIEGEVPNSGGFEFDTEDSLRINILLHLLALKVLYKRYVRIRHGKVYYRSLYVGDLSNTRYSLEEIYPTDDDGANPADIDPFYMSVIDKAILLAGLTYCPYSEEELDKMDGPALSLITNIYESAQFEKLSDIRKIYLKAEKERGEMQYRGYLESKRQEMTDYITTLYNKVEEDSKTCTANTDIQEELQSTQSDETYQKEIIARYQKIIDYGKGFNCDPWVWNYLLSCYGRFLIENGLYKNLYPMIVPWIQLCDRHLEYDQSRNYFCYYIAFSLMVELKMMDEFVKYANKYIQCCQNDPQCDSWLCCIDAATSLTGYYIRKWDHYNGYESIRIAMETLEKYESEGGIVDALRKANISSMYAHIQLQRGQYQLALDLYLKVMESYYVIQDEDSRELSVTYNNIGTCYCNLGQDDKAVEYQLKAADIIKKVSGDKDESLFVIYTNICTSLMSLHKEEEANHYMELALEIKEIYGFDESY